LLAAGHGNLCVVGDPLQNLFSWRGSDIRYLLDFQRDYPDGRVITLEQNYRSTQVILSVANALSAALKYGARNLWTANDPGVSIGLRVCDDPRSEAAFIATEVQRLMAEGTIHSPGECAVLYRTNAQARDLEMACLEAGLPYSVRGNSDFLARKEIRDLFAYLRLLHNPTDLAALGRVINTPPRRLAALEKRIKSGDELTLPRLSEEFPCGLTANRSVQSLRDFLEVIRMLTAMAEGPPGLLIDAVLEMSGYHRWLESQEGGEKRLANLTAFHDVAER
jgi:DNA helicase-2/ATP-dependent DNA helicase PcrA